MCELTEKLRSYNPTSGYSTTMRRAANEIDSLREKLSIENLTLLIWHISHNHKGISFFEALELAREHIELEP